jgi:2-keto-3-deoxy-L-fuconate dehydrogenase
LSDVSFAAKAGLGYRSRVWNRRGEVIVADLDAGKAGFVAKSIQSTGGKAQAVSLDVCDGESCNRIASAHSPDILVNNAGVGCVGTILQTPVQDLDRLYEVNVRGMFQLTKAILPGMIARRSGNIINLASVGGLVGIRDRLAYCTTKFAVVGFTKCLALDHAGARIRANCLCPGRVETPFVQARLHEYPDPEAAYREMSSTQLFERMIRPGEVAAAALYLAADESEMITGTALSIDCGWTAGK